MPLVLESLADAGPLSVDLSGIVPDRVATLSPADVLRLVIRADERPEELGALFHVAGDPASGRIECRGDFSRVHWIGAGLARGEVVVDGSAGRHAGEGMTGGTLRVRGDAGDWLACEMAGGEVHVAGSAGDNAAAALPGSRHGMRGGLVTIGGDSGGLAGARMRRGILAIGGDCGPAAGFELWAGTIVVGGSVGPQPGLGMRRGSLVVAGPAPEPSVLFRRGAVWSPAFLGLLAARLDAAGFRPGGGPTVAALAGPWRQWHGDLLAGGRGELFLRAAA
ncbi:MAG: formylmethanofuran dehydrogenase subunit C [Planctomycetia bacterium]|nr:formylmethanofuran dehydrogenase subunit C [Planctomycetia bacterium]